MFAVYLQLYQAYVNVMNTEHLVYPVDITFNFENNATLSYQVSREIIPLVFYCGDNVIKNSSCYDQMMLYQQQNILLLSIQDQVTTYTYTDVNVYVYQNPVPDAKQNKDTLQTAVILTFISIPVLVVTLFTLHYQLKKHKKLSNRIQDPFKMRETTYEASSVSQADFYQQQIYLKVSNQKITDFRAPRLKEISKKELKEIKFKLGTKKKQKQIFRRPKTELKPMKNNMMLKTGISFMI
ncbi:Hypothetical_protein [Hexamita inflata]|uniref:Hypothetical_protein n=1 Tax=Hexamita inflata TaxID=28002 RepID=A0AA86NQE6_9EUKA|nr:Hypothetical protein HINF_LOCUS12237 [Hexamita inflata]